MLKVKYASKEKIKPADFSKKDIPSFASYNPDLDNITLVGKRLLKYKNIIIVGRGGSVTSFKAFFESLVKDKTTKCVYIVDTADPDFLSRVKKACPIKNSIVIVISKSGQTIDVIENYLYFKNYKSFFITTPNRNPLHRIAEIKNIDVMEHPEIGGRYSGLTATALLPSFLTGIDINNLYKGALKAYFDFAPSKKNNAALKLASSMFYFEKKGFIEIYMPIYSTRLLGFAELIAQLVHESVGKKERGVTIIPVEAPECQHHSNQRYFGGRRNMQGVFLKLEKFSRDEKIKVEKDLKNIAIKSGKLEIIDGITLAKTMNAEFVGSFQDSLNRGMPTSVITLDEINEQSVGYFTGFLHYHTVYLSWLNRVNPFDQPEVESSKEISFKERLKR